MTFQTALFYIFAAILVFAGVRVVTARNPVHAVLWLVLACYRRNSSPSCSSSCTWAP